MIMSAPSSRASGSAKQSSQNGSFCRGSGMGTAGISGSSEPPPPPLATFAAFLPPDFAFSRAAIFSALMRSLSASLSAARLSAIFFFFQSRKLLRGFLVFWPSSVPCHSSTSMENFLKASVSFQAARSSWYFFLDSSSSCLYLAFSSSEAAFHNSASCLATLACSAKPAPPPFLAPPFFFFGFSSSSSSSSSSSAISSSSSSSFSPSPFGALSPANSFITSARRALLKMVKALTGALGGPSAPAGRQATSCICRASRFFSSLALALALSSASLRIC
mmetsp:Transcript_119/g.345  ORF Transcript_119/g.345 Transcript_119/m.345 type:complete len:276 (+) Transcript_119:61-888(+)